MHKHKTLSCNLYMTKHPYRNHTVGLKRERERAQVVGWQWKWWKRLKNNYMTLRPTYDTKNTTLPHCATAVYPQNFVRACDPLLCTVRKLKNCWKNLSTKTFLEIGSAQSLAKARERETVRNRHLAYFVSFIKLHCWQQTSCVSGDRYSLCSPENTDALCKIATTRSFHRQQQARGERTRTSLKTSPQSLISNATWPHKEATFLCSVQHNRVLTPSNPTITLKCPVKRQTTFTVQLSLPKVNKFIVASPWLAWPGASTAHVYPRQ